MIVRRLVIGTGRPKICVPIVAGTRQELFECLEEIRQKKACIHLVEWRVDWYEQCLQFQKVEEALMEIRKSLPQIPVLFTFRTKEEGGEKSIDFRDYKNLCLRVARKKLVDIVDIEIEKDGPVKTLISDLKEKGVAVLASNHHFEGTPAKEEMVKILEKMQKSGADIAKIAVMPKKDTDVMNLMEAAGEVKKKKKTPVVAIAMGEIGKISRAAGGFFGSDLTFGMIGKSSAPGQIEVAMLDKILRILEEKKKHVFLIGFMGSGKSRISSALSSGLNIRKIEMDEEIEHRQNKKITEIFEENGEAFFRDLETEFLRDISGESGAVVSCGGGVVLREENIELMKKTGRIILLMATPGTIFERVHNSKDRPILNNHMNVEYIRKLMEQRMPYYLKAADYIIETDGKSCDAICQEIQKLL